MVDIQTVSIAIASASVVAGVIYYAIQVRHQTKLRETDLMMRIWLIMSGKQFQKDYHTVFNCEYNDYDDFVKRYSAPLDETTEQEQDLKQAFGKLSGFGDLLGSLLKRKIADADFMFEMYPALGLWEKVKPIVEGVRKEIPWYCKDFEYYYNEMKKREQKLQQSKV
jgi:hypothetical protein